MLPVSGQIPLCSQIAEMLTRDIHTGVLSHGEKLPPERRMATTLGISVGTLRKALSELEHKNLLERVQGSGNFICHPLDIDNVYALFRLERHYGPATPSARLLRVEKIQKAREMPFTNKHQHVFRLTRIRILDGMDAALEEIFLDGRFSDSLDEDSISQALYHYYHSELGLRITRTEDRVSVATLPDWAPPEFQSLDISAWGFIDRYARDQDGVIAEYSRTWFNPNEVRFVAR